MGSVKQLITPSRLYRYRKIVDGTKEHIKLKRELSAIKNGYIYCPTPNQMNDPMEGVHSVTSMLRSFVDENRPGMLKEAQNYKDVMGIASLSETFNHEPMWAHYADDFAGICIAYSTKLLLQETDAQVHLVRMLYNEIAPVIKLDTRSARIMIRSALSAKTVRWMPEREWRIMIPHSGECRYGKNSVVTHVYLGSRIAPAHARLVTRTMQSLNIPVSRMEINNYSIEFKRVRKQRVEPQTASSSVSKRTARR